MLNFARIFSVFCLVSLGTAIAVLAGEWKTEAGDRLLSKDELTQMVAGKTLAYEGGAKSVLDENGGYKFYVGGKVYLYSYEITENSELCIASSDYGGRCDLIVMNGARIISINDKGERFIATVK